MEDIYIPHSLKKQSYEAGYKKGQEDAIRAVEIVASFSKEDLLKLKNSLAPQIPLEDMPKEEEV